MSPADAAVYGSLIAGAGGLIVAVINIAGGRGPRRTDKMETIADSGLALATEEKSRRVECEQELGVFKRVLRAVVRAYHSGDQAAVDAAITQAVDTLDAY